MFHPDVQKGVKDTWTRVARMRNPRPRVPVQRILAAVLGAFVGYMLVKYNTDSGRANSKLPSRAW